MYLQMHKNVSGETVTSARSLSPNIKLMRWPRAKTWPSIHREDFPGNRMCPHNEGQPTSVWKKMPYHGFLERETFPLPSCLPLFMYLSCSQTWVYDHQVTALPIEVKNLGLKTEPPNQFQASLQIVYLKVKLTFFIWCYLRVLCKLSYPIQGSDADSDESGGKPGSCYYN